MFQGYPYMESLRENKALLYALTSTGSFIVLLATGWLPELEEQFGLVEFQPEYRQMLLRILATDFFLSFFLDRFCRLLFGEGRLKSI